MSQNIGQEIADTALARIRRDADGPFDWDAARDLGLTGMTVSCDHGGHGLAPREALPLLGALAAQAVDLPLLETVILPSLVLEQAGGPLAALWLERLATGTDRIALACLEGDEPLNAERSGEGWTLTGTKRLVIGGESAAGVLVSARDGDTPLLFLVDPSGLPTQSYPTLDGLVAADIRFDGVPVSQQAMLPDGARAVEPGDAFAVAAACAQGAAIMRRLVSDTRDYCRERRQFDQRLSDFQVVQHRLVDMHIEARRAEAAASIAADALALSHPARDRALSAAKVTVCDSARFVGQNAVQLYGGMGMSAQMPVATLFKRLTVLENQFGSRDAHLARFMAQSG